jgi:hypothetical protein
VRHAHRFRPLRPRASGARRLALLLVLLAPALPAAAGAQRSRPTGVLPLATTSPLRDASLVRAGRGAATAQGASFAAAAVGGVLGSAVGLTVGILATQPDSCPADDDIVCPFRKLAVTGVLGVAGAAVGVGLAERRAGGGASPVGAVLGAVAGTVAGIGIVHLLTQELDTGGGRTLAIATMAVSQGVLAAAGSRLLGR